MPFFNVRTLTQYILIFLLFIIAGCGGGGGTSAQNNTSGAPTNTNDSSANTTPKPTCDIYTNSCEIGAINILSLIPKDISPMGSARLSGSGFKKLKKITVDDQLISPENYSVLNDHEIQISFPMMKIGRRTLKIEHEEGDTKSIPFTVHNTVINAQQISAAHDSACALLIDGTVTCWGENSSFYLSGSNQYVDSSSNFAYSIQGVADAVQIAVGASHSCALIKNHTVRCWGSTEFQPSGGDGYHYVLHPVAEEVPNLNNVVEIAVGDTHSCARLSDGSVSCWGLYFVESGAVGLSLSKTPVKVAGLSNVVKISAADDISCATDNAGYVSCWGREGLTPKFSGLTSGLSSVAVSSSENCAISSNNKVNCSIYYYDSRSGYQTYVLPITNIEDASQIVTDGGLGCVLKIDSSVQCWGSLQISPAHEAAVASNTFPINISGIKNDVVSVAMGRGFVCLLTTDHAVRCSELQDGFNADTDPIIVQGIENAESVTVGGKHRCAKLKGGSFKCWGSNFNGQLGTDTADRTYYEAVSPPTSPDVANPSQIALGASHGCALLTDHSVDCWGDNQSHQLAQNSYPLKSSVFPLAIDNISDAVSISAGSAESCVLSSDGHVTCWGDGGYGVLILNTQRQEKIAATQIKNFDQVKSIAAGATSCAIKLDNSVWCWGDNQYRQIDDSKEQSISSPVRIVGWDDVADVSVGGAHMCVLKKDQTVECMGSQESSYGIRTVNEPNNKLTGVTAITSGDHHACAILADTSVKCWGGNVSGGGQRGRIVRYSALTPTFVPGLMGVKQISASGNTTCAVYQDGFITCWGPNDLGRLGQGAPELRQVLLAN